MLAGVPDAPTNAPTSGSGTSATQVVVEVQAVTDTNGAAITSYHIVIDDGEGGDFVELQGYTSESTSLTATLTSVTAGNNYRVKYRAKNPIGYSDYSSVSYIEASSLPETPAAPAIVISGTNAEITWALPYNSGSEITSATILIKQSDNSFSEDTTNCDGSDSTIFKNKACSVPLTTLGASPYSLAYGASIIATVKVTNGKGDSSTSGETSSPPTMQVVPSAPSVAPIRDAATAGTTMVVTMTALTGDDTGGADITSYNLAIDATGTGSGAYAEVVGESSANTDLTVSITGLTAGQSYALKYRC